MHHKDISVLLITALLLVTPLLRSEHQAQSSFLDSTTHNQNFDVFEPATNDKLVKFIEWLEKNREIWGMYHWDKGYLEHTPIYILDINNDNTKEFVLVDIAGSGSFVTFFVFAEKNEGFTQLEIPGDFSCDHEYHNPFTHRAEHFVFAQNKVYIFGTNDYSNIALTRNIYLWQDDIISLVGDPFWLEQQRELFKQLYSQKRYHDAASLLQQYEATFGHTINPYLNLWIRNDLALALLKDECPNAALKILDNIRHDTAFDMSSQQLKKAVATNIQLCCEAQKNSNNKGNYDYSWLIKYKGVSNNTLCASDKRIDKLLAATVPEICDPNNRANWRDLIKGYLWGPGAEAIRLFDERYVVFDGFECHNAQTKALFWCDMQEKVSAVATHETEDSLYITSMNLAHNELPNNFIQHIKDWIKRENINVMHVQFYASNGSNIKYALYQS